MYSASPEWKHFKFENRTAEGRMIHSPTPSGQLVIYVPGFPGGGATLFENHFSDFLKDQQYNLVVIRHNGTRLNGDFSDDFLNREKFPKAIPYHDGDYIGGGSFSMMDWILEPETVLRDIGASFSNIVVVGHSFGAVCALYSLARIAESSSSILERVRTCVCLAPAVGLLKEHGEDIMETLWTPEFLNSSDVAEKVFLRDVEEARANLRAIYKDLPHQVSGLLRDVRKVFVHVERDEYLRHNDVEEFMLSCGENSQMFVDRFDRHDPRLKYDAHDMPNYPQQLLLDMIVGNYDSESTSKQSDGFMD